MLTFSAGYRRPKIHSEGFDLYAKAIYHHSCDWADFARSIGFGLLQVGRKEPGNKRL
jgi:hypothetical protein